MKSIQRKSMLYKTGVEYGDYTMNHVLGCSHGCKYPCYAFMMKKRFGQVASYDEWIDPSIVSNTLELLDNEIPRLKEKIQTVQLCFTTDPFMYGYDEVQEMSLASIHKLNDEHIKCTVLTKGILPSQLADCSSENEYGITLISLNENFRKQMEPGSAPYRQRIESLRTLHDKGCKTWVSIEPYPTPNIISQDLNDILEAISFVDKIIFGRTNYCREVNAYSDHRLFYNICANKVVSYCVEHDIKYYIKKGTITTK